MLKYKLYILISLSLIVISCETKDQKNIENLKHSFKELWLDKTEVYLPQTSEWTNRVEVADLNGDGMVDLLFANGGNYSESGIPESCRVFLNNGPDKMFDEITDQVFSDKKFLSRVIKVQDINQDNIPDIIVGTTYQSQSQLYIGIGNGKFINSTKSNFPDRIASVGDLELGDVDNDGDLDMVLADWGPGSNMNNQGGRTMLWLNDGQGLFTDVTSQQMPELLIQFSWDIEFFDFDNDFDLDIAISCKRCATSRIFENDGKGNFKDKRLLPAYTNNYELEPMDINNDGFLDLLTVNDGEIVKGKSYSRREHVFLNIDGEKFIDATDSLWLDSDNIGEDDNNIVFLDYDSDGDPDFILSSLTGEDRLLVNDGKGTFKLIQPVLKGKPTPLTLSLMLADINDDNKLDIIMGQGEGQEGIEERIFIGNNILPDTSPPIISHLKVDEDIETELITLFARIHDNKSPSMPQDWKSVEVVSEDMNLSIPMNWYGEYLWVAKIKKSDYTDGLKICATDYSGNMRIKEIK